MPTLPSIDNCTACGACIDTCKHGAISLFEDKNGYYNIAIDEDKCVECKLCEKHCHILNQHLLVRNDLKNVRPLAGWSLDEALLQRSATGAIFAQIACDMLAEGNTYVYGASLQEDSSVKHIEISEKAEIYKLQNSKYQQSVTCGIFKLVQKRLREGARVLFSGVPCQVAALYTYLGKRVDLTDNLYTIEVICHGVPTNELHRLGIKYNNAKRIVAYRTKKNSGWIYGKNNRVVYELSDGRLKYLTNPVEDFLFRSYLSFSFSRKNCYKCKYATLKRVSDLTIGDFWGFEKSKEYFKYGNYMGTSIIMPNSSKGKWMIEQSRALYLVNASWKDVLPLNQNLFMPTNRYAFKGYDKVCKLLNVPDPFRKILFMNGSTNKFINKLYSLVFNILLSSKRNKAETEIKEKLKKTIEYLSNNIES